MTEHPHLLEAKNQFEQLARYIPMAVAMFDREMRYLFANERWLEDYALDTSIIGQSHYEVFKEIGADWKEIHQRCLDGDVHHDDLVRFPRLDGSVDWLRREIRPWYATDGTIGGLIMYTEVITDRKKAQDAIEAQRQFLRRVIDLNTSFIFAKDEEGRFTLVNKALADHYNATPEEMVGKIDEDFNPNINETRHFRRDDLAVIRTRTPRFIPEEPVSNVRTGETRWYQTVKVPLISEDGQSVQLLGVATDITDRKKAQDAVEAQRQFLRRVIDLNTSFIFAKDEDGRFTLVNKALADHYNATPEEMVGKFDEDFNPDRAETQHFRRDDLAVIRTRTPKFIPEEPVTNVRTGETRWFQTVKVPLISEDGESVQLLGVATDITDRKKAQDALQEQSRFLRQIIDLNTSLIFAKDENCNFILVNKALADDFGVTPEEMVGKSDKDFNQDPGQVRNIRRDDLEVIRTHQPKFIPEEPITSTVTGETRWFQTVKVPLISEDGQTVQLLGVATDITDRKKAQDALQQQSKFLRQVIDLTTSLIFAKDEEGRFILVNRALADLYHTTPEEMVGKFDEDFNPFRQETRKYRADDLEVIRTHQPKFIPEEPVTNVKTGETRWFQTTKVPLISQEDGTVQLLGVSTDITERKKAQEQLQKLVAQEQRARQEAETAAKMKDLFLANMSHELRTPMNAIIGFLREMIYSQQLDADNLHMAERSLANSKRLLMLINSVLDLSRLATGSLEIFAEEVSLPALAQMIIDDLEIQAKEKNLALDLTIDPALPDVILHDEERLLQIITNLMVNGIKFTEKGQVQLTLRRRVGTLEIQVADTGIGIPPAMREAIFDDFVQLDSSSKKRYGGAGLGLSIVKNLVDLMDGTIDLESKLNQYSIFTVTLPLELKKD